MTTSESVDKIFQAIIKAQSEMGSAKKDSDNPFFKSKYADLSEIIDVSKPVLTANGIGVIQSPGGSGSVVTVTCRIIHTSGQWVEDVLTLNAVKTDPQAIGSAITYGRRYQLAALFNIAQEDDDGNKATNPEQNPVTIQTVNPEIDQKIKDLTDWINLTPPVFTDVQKLWAEKQISERNLEGMKLAITKAGDLQKAQKA